LLGITSVGQIDLHPSQRHAFPRYSCCDSGRVPQEKKMHRRGVLCVSCAALLAIAACSREQAPPAPESAPEVPALESASAPPEPPPADSGLAIKRGMLSLAKDHATFRPCGESDELWLLDQTENALESTFGAELQGGPVKLYVEAYGERGPVSEDVPEARGHAGLFVLEEVLYATIAGAERACDQPAPGYIVAARGNEPFWSVEVTETQMIWRSPEDPKEIALEAAPAQDAEGAVRYQARGGDHELELLLDAQTCRDSMSGDFFAYAARAMFDGAEFKGCARVGK
jgi:uncharacterized membrane protein